VATTAASAPAPTPQRADDEALIEATRARVGSRLAGRELIVTAVGGLSFLVVAGAMVAALPTHRSASLPLTVALVAAFALAARVEFEVAIGAAVASQLILVPMLFLLPAREVPLLVAAGYLLSYLPNHFRGNWHPGRVLIHLASSWYAVGPALVLALAGEPGADWRRHGVVFVLALAAQFALDLIVSGGHAVSLGVPVRQVLAGSRWPWLVDAALAPLALVVTQAARNHPFDLLLVLPLLGLLAFLARERRAHVDHALELSHAYRGTALLLGDVVEADDAYTGSHSRDVVTLVLGVADALGLEAHDRRDAELTALLHDVGKIRIPSEIIGKAGPLTPDERAIVETHTLVGEEMLDRVGGLLGEVGRLVRSCHERWDGNGYPDGLRGGEIPLVARIVCGCDAFSAMTTDRPYRRALLLEEALAELHAQAGRQFDPVVVEALATIAGRLERPAIAPVL